jgi:hypothetical protein
MNHGTLFIAADGGKRYVIQAKPHVCIKLKRIFPRLGTLARDTYALADTPEVSRDLEWFDTRYPLEMDDATRAHLTARASEHREKTTIVDALLSGREKLPPLELALPARDYQKAPAAIVLASGGLLVADEMGLGKTVEAICMFCDERTLPALVVTMTSLPEQWRAEVQKFAPGLRVAVLQDTTPYDLTKGCARGRHKFTEREPGNPSRCKRCGAKPRETFKGHPPLPPPDVIITSYSKIHGWAETLAAVVQSVVWDEAQELRHRMGSSKDMGKVVTRKYAAAELIADHVSYRMALTGTPVYNWGGELFNVMHVTRPGALGTEEEFNEEWTHIAETGEGRSIKDPKAFGEYLRDEGLLLRRTRADVGRELPPLTNVLHEVSADLSAFDSVGDRCAELARFLLGVEKTPPRGAEGPPEMGPADPAKKARGAHMSAAEELSWKLRQATGIAKAPYVAEFVRLLAAQQGKVLLFGWHREVYRLWMELLGGHDDLPDLKPVLHTGSESPAAKIAARDAFVSGDSQVLIMSLRSAAGVEGLQSVCSDIVYGELDWSPGVHEQDSMRIQREGVPRPVFAYYLWADEGADPIMMDVLGLKGAEAHGIRDPGLDIVEQLKGGGHQVKKLALAYLEQREKRERKRIEKGMAAE